MIRRHFNHHILFGRILRYFRIFRVSAQFWAQIWTRDHQKWVHTTQLSLGNTPGAGFEISWFLGCHIISTIQSSSVNSRKIFFYIVQILIQSIVSEDILCTIFTVQVPSRLIISALCRFPRLPTNLGKQRESGHKLWGSRVPWPPTSGDPLLLLLL